MLAHERPRRQREEQRSVAHRAGRTDAGLKMRRAHPWAVCALLVVTGCHSATPKEQLTDLLSEAEALQRCETSNGVGSKQCADQRATYVRDLAAFRAKYGR
jgi:hypothetical protein